MNKRFFIPGRGTAHRQSPPQCLIMPCKFPRSAIFGKRKTLFASNAFYTIAEYLSCPEIKASARSRASPEMQEFRDTHQVRRLRYLLFHPFFVHVDGISAKSSGYISSLPRSIVAESTIFENAEYPENEPIGPTAPNPGPILL